ncbi:helix-turn-helix transcriptional regulator [Natronosporangium hydrolyticum]|uniref:Helix-turn-helix transcriptional regulator n=1 Tax=Natronosporangium hydrolyticum TaxID=2811111 RepID=A0A895Y643_9ACTN|nr:helix-turn-helix transcriptional regulator [Natronosporangium hydrolyticum]QSB12851.1 helix-turn-helix transcriptional regulator [Natronosporangium hydrolyticum]
MPRRTFTDPRFPAMLREIRQQRGMSLRDLYNASYVGRSTISQLETGKTQPTPSTVRALDSALEAKGQLMALVSEREETEPATGLWETAELMNRLRASDVSPAVVEGIHATVYAMCCDYGWQDAQQLRAEGLRWLREVDRLLRSPVGLRAHRELLVAAGWLALLVGCIEYDLQMRASAEATRTAALELATEVGHGEIAAWAWEMSSWFALTQGRYRDVVTAADAGMGAAGEHTAAVQLAGQAAKAHARMGDPAAVEQALTVGRQLLDRHQPPSRPDHHFVVDPDKWDFYAMDAYRLVRRDDLAAHHALRVIELGTAADGTEKAPMRMAEARLTLSTVAARAGELEQAVAVGLEAFQSRRRSMPTLLMVAQEVGQELQRQHREGRPVQDFRAALRDLSNS